MNLLQFFLENKEDLSYKHIVCSFTYNLDATFYYLNLIKQFDSTDIYLRLEPFSKFWDKTGVCLTTHNTLINDFANNSTNQIWKKRKTLFLLIESDYPVLSLNLLYTKISNMSIVKN